MIISLLNPIKGVAKQIFFQGDAFAFNNNYDQAYIVKDGGAQVLTTNIPVLSTGFSGTSGQARLQASVLLTATEMNADTISIWLTTSANHNSTVGYTTFFTQVAELSSVPNLNSSMADKITAIFQYLFFKRTVTASQEKLYKSDDTTILATGTVSDDNTTFTKGKPS